MGSQWKYEQPTSSVVGYLLVPLKLKYRDPARKGPKSKASTGVAGAKNNKRANFPLSRRRAIPSSLADLDRR